MQITSNTTPETNIVEIEFNVNAEDFEKACNATYLKMRKNISLPGFRKGKAPRKMIETHYGEGVFYEDAVNDLYNLHIPKVIDETGLEIVAPPAIEVKEVSRENGVTYKVKFTVKPEVEIADYKGVEVEVQKREVTDEDIDRELELIRADNARIIDASDRSVKNGDEIVFDFTGFCEDELFDGGSATDFRLEVGSKRFIPGFEEQIIGKSVSEDFDVNVTFPEDYPAENVRGKDAIFKCTISEIYAKEAAELDDEFVKDISEFDTIAEFREDIRQKLEERFGENRDVKLEDAVAEKVVELLKAEIPQAMYEQRMDEMARDWAFKYNMEPETFARSTGSSFESYRESFREIAEKQIKFRLALDKISEVEDIQVSDDEIEKEYQKMADDNRMKIEKVREIASFENVKTDLKILKALELIKENASVTDVPYSPSEEEKAEMLEV